MRLVVPSLCLALVLALISPPAGAAADGPAERTAAMLSSLKQMRPPPAEGPPTAADRAHNQKISAGLDGYIDYGRIARDAIAPHRAQLSAPQLAAFERDFRALVRLVAFDKSGAMMSQATVTVAPPEARGNATAVTLHAVIVEQDVDSTLTFVWEQSGGAYRVVDVSLDGGSLVKDYQNQFGRLIKKNGVDGFLQRLKQKVRAAEAAAQAG